ncbi:hypothetical protein M407DRAFT_241809 [Tulasnella calospora MUT 4182]|uniref:Extracellular membrane protein CFEM domain-containing protein n=1 Tax=Tulasnella calospora MUT 4182 TaxID=1051891 RepID=A0A0C3QHS2_9AGAM|nr:hypothetical protein M407DRAFT_241809 [Tulasnella calospora MUT 4182]
MTFKVVSGLGLAFVVPIALVRQSRPTCSDLSAYSSIICELEGRTRCVVRCMCQLSTSCGEMDQLNQIHNRRM